VAHTYGTKARIPETATTTNANPVTFAITCAAGTTVLWLGIVVNGTTQRTGGAPTYNGIAMTQAGSKRNAGGTPETYVEQFYLLDPPTGSSYNISIPNTNTLNLTATAATGLAGAGKASALDAQSGAAGSSTNPAATVTTTVAGDIVFAICGDGATTWNPTAWSGVQLYDWDAGTRGHGAQYVLVAGTGSQATNWTFGTSEDWAISNAAFKIVSVYRLDSSYVLPGKAVQLEPTIVTQTQEIFDVDKLIERTLHYGVHTETANGITMEQGLPISGKASILEPTYEQGFPVYVDADKLISRAELLTPAIISESLISPSPLVGTTFPCEPSISAGITLSPDVLEANAEQFAPTVVTVFKVSVAAGLLQANIVQVAPAIVAEFWADLLPARAVLKDFTVSAGVTVSVDVLQTNTVLPTPALQYEYAISVERLQAVAEPQELGTGTATSVSVETLQGTAAFLVHAVSASIAFSVDCLTAVSEFYGTHIETANGISLEQRIPFDILAEIQTPTITATSPQQVQTVLVEVLEARATSLTPIYGASGAFLVEALGLVAEFYGTHTETSTGVTLEGNSPLIAISRFLEHDVNVNTEYGQPILIQDLKGEGYGKLYGVHTSTDITLIADSLLPVRAVQYEPIIGNWKNATVHPDLLEGSGIQQQVAAELGGGATISVEVLAGIVDLQTPTLVPIKIPIITTDPLVAKGSQEIPENFFDYTVLPDELIGLGSLNTPTLIPHIRVTFTVDGLEAWGGLQSSVIGEARGIIVSAGWLPSIGILFDPPHVGRTIVRPSTLVGMAKLKKNIEPSFRTVHRGEKPVFYYHDKSGVHPVFSLTE
jgi:hypothetical protein